MHHMQNTSSESKLCDLKVKDPVMRHCPLYKVHVLNILSDFTVITFKLLYLLKSQTNSPPPFNMGKIAPHLGFEFKAMEGQEAVWLQLRL